MICVSVSNEKGKQHVLNVDRALKAYLHGNIAHTFPETIEKTKEFILSLYPNVTEVRNKYETNQSNEGSDLLLICEGGKKVLIELFTIIGNGVIQPKNLGAKSFLSKYFQALALQEQFNKEFQKHYLQFLRNIVQLREPVFLYDQEKNLKKAVKKHFPKFVNEINPLRRAFLFGIREAAFQGLIEQYNSIGLEQAFSTLMQIDRVNVVTRTTKQGDFLSVDQLQTKIDMSQNIQLYKKGNDTIGIRIGEEALTLRFKFESSPTSSVKIATSFERFPQTNLQAVNKQSVREFEMKLSGHSSKVDKEDSNSVGKMNEAMVYYRLILNNPIIYQVEESTYHEFYEQYASNIKTETIQAINRSSVSAVERLTSYLKEKHGDYVLESIQLVPDSYLIDPLDTSDLRVVLKAKEQYIEEFFSLKALKRRGNNSTMKNPGIGSILGEEYFDIGTLQPLVNELKSRFKVGEISYQEVTEIAANGLHRELSNASQSKLFRGLVAIFGKIAKLTIFYLENQSEIKEPPVFHGPFIVESKRTWNIVTIRWDNAESYINLRVKQSGRQDGTWKSLKLSCESKS